MGEAVARALVGLAAAWILVGIPFAVAFVLVGAPRLDPDARGTGPGFRLVLLPGAVALWPLLLVRWIRGSRRG